MTLPATRRLRALLAAALAAASIVVPLALDSPTAHAASSFALFDNTSYNNANLQANYGLTPSAVVYDSWSISCQNVDTYSCILPPESDYQAKIKALDATIPSTSPLTLDFEGIDGTSGTPIEQATNDCQAWQTLLSWTRAVIPAAQPLGAYSYDWDQSSEEISCNTTLHKDGLTFFAPSLYTYTSDLTGSDWTSWTSRVTESISNDNTIAPGQPIYPYIWPQWDTTGNTFMDSASWLEELDYLKSETQGAIVWSGGTDLGASSCGWIGSTHNFMTALTGTGASTGSLDADVQFPNTCMLTRGQSTAVPVTITNNGSTTSAATTLTISGDTGISGTASPSAVPAIAAGGTWSTTVDLTVGASASLGDTVIALNLAGEGVQNRTAIIQDPDLALNDTATQSSTDGSQTASLADDGNTATYSETDSGAQAWWQTDLGSSQSIGGVDLYAGTVDPSNYYLIISNSSSPAIQTAPLPPNQWIETSTGTWVMNVYTATFRYPSWKADTDVRGMGGSTDVPVSSGISGRYVRVQLAGTGQLSLAEADVTPGEPDGPNLLSTGSVANGGFETGSLAPWSTAETATVVTSPKVSGNDAVELGTGAFLQQTITVKPNTTYTLSGYIQPQNDGNAVELGVENYGGSYSTDYTSTTGWTLASLTFTTGSTNTTATIFVYHDVGTDEAYADDITCYPAS